MAIWGDDRTGWSDRSGPVIPIFTGKSLGGARKKNRGNDERVGDVGESGFGVREN